MCLFSAPHHHRRRRYTLYVHLFVGSSSVLDDVVRHIYIYIYTQREGCEIRLGLRRDRGGARKIAFFFLLLIFYYTYCIIYMYDPSLFFIQIVSFRVCNRRPLVAACFSPRRKLLFPPLEYPMGIYY